MARGLDRDRLTWLAYLMLAFFAYLQAAPGLVVVHLRDELDLSHAVSGLHVTVFAVGSMVAGLASAPLERVAGRRTLLWSASALMSAGAAGLTAGSAVAVTVGSASVMGVGGGLLLIAVQAALVDRHGERRTVALAEANISASLGYLALIGMLSITATLRLGWRTALLIPLVVPALAFWSNRHVVIDAPPAPEGVQTRLPGAFRIAAAMLFCTTAAEWCVTAWGATLVEEATSVSTDTAVTLMGGYFGGVLLGRVVGSRLARRYEPTLLLALALGVSGAGFSLLWPATAPAPALLGLSLLGIGLGNLFPMGVSVAAALAPAQAASVSGRAVAVTSFAIVLAPVTVGTLADATSLRAAITVVPGTLALAAGGLVLVHRAGRRASAPGTAGALP